MLKQVIMAVVVLTTVVAAQTDDSKITENDYTVIKYSDQLDIEDSIKKNVLFDGSRRKIAQLTLNDGKSLGSHTAAMPFMVYCVSGEGELILGENDKTVVLKPGSMVTVEADIPHDVVAKPDLSIVVIRFMNDRTIKK